MKKKALSLLLSLALCLTLLPTAALAEEGQETAHQHPICGMTCTHTGEDHANTAFAAALTCDADGALQIGGSPAGSAKVDGTEYFVLPAGSYYLDGDITSRLLVQEGSSVTLCLNGQSILAPTGSGVLILGTLALTDCAPQDTAGSITHAPSGSFRLYGTGVTVQGGSFWMYGGTICNNYSHNGNGGGVYISNGTFTMSGGSITGNRATNSDKNGTGHGSGVYISNGTFTMSGGSITGNVSDLLGSVCLTDTSAFTMLDGAICGNDSFGACGGVYVERDSTLAMYGGSITENHCTGYGNVRPHITQGGGVYLSGTMTVGGAAVISNNWMGGRQYGNGANAPYHDCTERNVYVTSVTTSVTTWRSIAISSETPLTDDAFFGVTTDINPSGETSCSVATNATKNDLQHFFSDGGYQVTLSGDTLQVNSTRIHPNHNWTYTLDGTNTILANCSAENCPHPNGGSMTISAPAALVYDGKSKPAVLTDHLSASISPSSAITYTKDGSRTSVPTDAGTYLASFTLGTVTATVEYTIEQAEPECTVPTGLTAAPGQKLSDVTFPEDPNGTWRWLDADQDVGGLGEHPFQAVFTPTDTNYKSVTKDVTVTVRKAAQTIQVPSNASILKNGIAVDIADWASAEGSLSYSLVGEPDGITLTGTMLTAAETTTVESFQIKVRAAETDNALAAETTFTVTVTDRAQASLTVSQDSWQYGETALPPSYEAPAAQYTTSVTYAVQGSEDYTAAVPSAAGSYTVRVVLTTADTVFTGTQDFAITRRPVTVSGITAQDKTYDGGTSAQLVCTNAVFSGKLDGDTLTVSAAGTFASKNAGNQTVTLSGLTLGGKDAGNYTLTEDSQTSASATIHKKELSVGEVTITPKVYDTSDSAFGQVSHVALTGLADGETLTFGSNGDYGIYSAKFNSPNVKDANTITGTVTLYASAYQNYTFANDSTDAAFTKTGASITPAAGRSLGTVSLSQKYTDETVKTYAPDWSALMPEKAGDLRFELSSAVSGTASLAKSTADADGKLTYQIKDAAANAVITWTFTIHSDNYQDCSFQLILTLADRDPQTIGLAHETVAMTYGDGAQITVSNKDALHGALSYAVTSGSDVISVDASGAITALRSGAAVVTVTVSGDSTYAPDTKTVSVQVAKREITVQADDKSMTAGDALPAFTVRYGNFASGDTADTVLASKPAPTTAADGKTAGKFAITPAIPTLQPGMEAKYTVGTPINGTLTVEARSYSGGGGGGGNAATYPILLSKTENGTVSASAKSASPDSTVTITVTPNSGYTLETLTAVDENGRQLVLSDSGSGKYTFTMPASPVTVTATFMEDNGVLNFFYDVPNDSYCYDAVKWAAENGITNGIRKDFFGPNVPCTRGQAVTFLWRAAGKPAADSAAGFHDVSPDAYCAEAIRWAVPLGIVTGYGDGSFRPDNTVTREQMAAFLYRFAKAQGMDTTQGGMAVREFDDFSQLSAYAGEAVAWAVNAGILKGDHNRLMPQAPCTRGQIVTFLWRLYQGK